MKPEPLNLDKSKLISVSEFKELINRISKTGHSFPHGDTCRTCESDCEEVIDFTLKKVKQRIKSACEFYLRYKDNPRLLGKEHPLLIEKVNELYRKHIEIEEELGENYDPKSKTFIDEYNLWLFKLAFSDIFTEEKERGKE